MELTIRRIKENELEEFASILQEAANWLKNNEMEMWNPNELSTENLLSKNTIEEMHIGFFNNESAASMILQEQDPLFWSDETPSLYVHKLTVRRKYGQKGFAEQMINWAKSQAKQQNKKFLRLDCDADRPKLRNFYEKQGFKKVKEEFMFDKFFLAFYEFEIK